MCCNLGVLKDDKGIAFEESSIEINGNADVADLSV
jgi:hypothetical protein